MTELTPTTVLRRAPELEIRVGPDGDVRVTAGNDEISCGANGFAILDVFSRPIAFSDALAALNERVVGAQDWFDLTSVIVHMHRSGALEADGEQRTRRRTRERGYFDTPRIHIAMLDDRRRTAAFIEALGDIVTENDVVVDIGTGTGILAAAAARAGARRVYALEATPIAGRARALLRANGLQDRVTLVEGWSTKVELPERADVAVTEILGDEPLGERILEATLDARRRLLKENPRLIPSRVRILGVPVFIPDDYSSGLTFTGRNTSRWTSWYGFDFSVLTDHDDDRPRAFTAVAASVEPWPVFSDPVVLADLDLTAHLRLELDTVVRTTASMSGTVNGVYVFFEAQLGPRTVITSNPRVAARASSWGVNVWLAPRGLDVAAGEAFSIAYTYRGGAEARILAD
jgi:hypothetical protein